MVLRPARSDCVVRLRRRSCPRGGLAAVPCRLVGRGLPCHRKNTSSSSAREFSARRSPGIWCAPAPASASLRQAGQGASPRLPPSPGSTPAGAIPSPISACVRARCANGRGSPPSCASTCRGAAGSAGTRRVVDPDAAEPAEQRVVFQPLHQEPFRTDRIERL